MGTISIGEGVAICGTSIATIIAVYKFAVKAKEKAPETKQNDFLEKILKSFIDMTEKHTAVLTIIQSKVHSIHDTSRDNNLLLKEIKADLGAHTKESYKQGERIENDLNELRRGL